MSDDELTNKISDAAAMLFWTFCAKRGFDYTVGAVQSDGGEELFAQEGVEELLKPYGFSAAQDDFDDICERIFDEMVDSTVREVNLQGVIYAEDAATGRSPSAARLEVSSLCIQPRQISGHQGLERLGELCLRHPLPAVVFSETRPRTGFFQVASTRRALRADVPMFLSCTGETAMPGGLIAISGVFHILVPDVEAGDRWGAVIQNSTRVTAGIAVQVGGMLHRIEVDWPT
jgi:hypothetical protein